MFSSVSYNRSLGIPVKPISVFIIIVFKLVSPHSDWHSAPGYLNQLLLQKTLHTGKVAPDLYLFSQNRTWTAVLHDETWLPYTISSVIKEDTFLRWELIWEQKEQLKETWCTEATEFLQG